MNSCEPNQDQNPLREPFSALGELDHLMFAIYTIAGAGLITRQGPWMKQLKRLRSLI